MTGGATAARVDGFAIVDKPTGASSYKVLAGISRSLGPGVKSGHAGTLDPFASGVLVCLFGRYTRLSDWFMGAAKGYEATLSLGTETDTLDLEGAVVATAGAPAREALDSALASFRGPIMQTPPAYSAIHVDGKRSYDLARAGRAVELAPREVRIERLELLDYDGLDARLLVHCSKGTYIRSLARDIALACGSRGHLKALRRTFSGPFSLASALAPEDVKPDALRALAAGDAAGLGLETLELGDDEARLFRHGLPLSRMAVFKDRRGSVPVAAFDRAGSPLGIATPAADGHGWRYALVFEDAPGGGVP